MKYGVVSDSHDNFYNLEKAMAEFEERGASTCFHLGDFCQGDIVRAMIAHTNLNWVCVWGNVDGAKAKIALEFGAMPNFDIGTESFREFDVGGQKVFLTHFPLLALNAAETGKYAACFYGHDHAKHSQLVGKTLLANPGEIAGFKSTPSFGLWDSDSNEFEIIELEDFRTTKA